ncbi:MAG: glycosyltransferase [Dehalococcoidia bacterium]
MPQQNLFFDILFYLQTAIIVGLVVLLLISLTNLRYLRRLHSYPPPARWPRFSVLVPARNEEQNIANSVSGLLAQDYPDYQLIVLDDNSTDRTWEILQGFAQKNSALKLLKGKPLPDDWLGKHWACSQLAEAADGELLLFVDADTIHAPDMLRCAAAAMAGEDAALISALPTQIVVTWSEQLTIPAFYMGTLCGIPIGLTRVQRNPLLFSCVGQFLLFTREAYDASGGYAAVRQNVVDDLAIGRRVHSMGLRYRLLDGNSHVSCRMYHNSSEVWKGLTKSNFATFNFDPFLLIFMYLLVLAVFIGPLVILGISLAQPQPHVDLAAAALMAIFLTLVLWWVNQQRFHFPQYLIVIYPFSAIAMTVIAIASMILTMQGKAQWKGRNMPKNVKP